MKRSIKMVPFLILLFLLIFTVPAPANAASQKAQVRKTVNTFFRYAKKMKVKKMEKCFVKQGQKIFSDPKKFYRMIRPYTKKMTWKIKKIRVKGNRAAVKIKVNFQSLYLSYWNSLLQTYRYANVELDEPPKNKKYMLNALKQEIQKNGANKVHTSIRIRLRKVNGKWKIAQPTERLINILYCDYIYTVQDFMGTE